MYPSRMSPWVLVVIGLFAAGVVGEEVVVPVSAQELLRYQELDSRPIQALDNVGLAEFLDLRSRVAKADPQPVPVHEEAGRLAMRSLGQEFRLNAVQFDLAEGDCVSFVNRTLALSVASDWQSYYLLIERIRHKDGVVNYRNRNFFTLGDWLPNNAWLLRDVTPELGPAENRPAESFTHVVRPKVFEERPAAPGSAYSRIIFKGSDYESADKEVRTDTFIPRERMQEVLGDLQTGDVVLVLRPANDGHLGCDHMGLIVREPGVVTFVHSAPPGVRQELLLAFLDRCNWVAGLKFLRFRDNARELARPEMAKMAPNVAVPSPAEQQSKVEALRAGRARAAQQ